MNRQVILDAIERITLDLDHAARCVTCTLHTEFGVIGHTEKADDGEALDPDALAVVAREKAEQKLAERLNPVAERSC